MSGAWRGDWIGPEESPRSFTRVHFRRTVELDAVPGSAAMRVTADSRYVLLVNGVEVGRGPQRSQPWRLFFDEWDIASLLREGVNVVAVLVTWFGDSNAIWQRPVPSGRLGAGPALLVDGTIGDRPLCSDTSWKAAASPAWTVFPRRRLDGLPAERLDARLLAPDWAAPGFPDDDWADAALLGAGYQGAAGRSRPPVAPYAGLRPRSIPVPLTTTVRPATVQTRVVPRVHPPEEAHPFDSARDAGLRTSLESVAPGSEVAATMDLVVHLDFGRIVTGLFAFDLDAPRGTVVDVAFHERDGRRGGGLEPATGARYVARGTHDSYRALESSGMRSATLLIQPAGPAEVAVRDLRLDELLPSFGGGAFFASSDPELTSLWTAGVRTVQVNSADAMTDCPTREQRAWVGDGVVHQAVHLVANEDWRAAAAYVDLCRSPRPDGLLPMSVAGDLEAAGGITIPSWSLHWLHGVHTLFRYAGAVDEVVDSLPVARGVLRWFAAHADDRGTLSDLPEWNLVDWSSVVTGGRSAAVTALWCRGLREYAEICAALGDQASARWAHTHHAAAVAGFEDFWDADRGLYVDSIVDGARCRPCSQATNAIAIVSRLAPPSRWQTIVDGISDENRLVVRSWIAAPGGGVDLQKWARVRAGEWVLDWDVDRQVVRAQPFFSYIVHDAYALTGRFDALHASLRAWTAFLEDGFDTFGEAWEWGTPCHGWSATPTKDLTRYVLGVTPEEPGYRVVRIAPRPAGSTVVEGAAPTPHGLVHVRAAGGVVEFTSPVPVVFIALDGSAARLPAGHHRRDLVADLKDGRGRRA